MNRGGFAPAASVLKTQRSLSKKPRRKFSQIQLIDISTIAAIANVISMTTISVTEDVKEKLLKVASELQIKTGHRVDLNDALRFLVDQQEKNPRLLDEACSPTTGVKEALEE